MNQVETDILILGAGGAGLFAALHAKKANPDLDVTIAVKGLLGKCGCTRMVQGGYNVALAKDDSIERHFMDTIEGGAWLNDQDLAWLLVTTAPVRIRELENELGCFFDRNPDGTVHQKAFAGQTFDRTVHKGDLTGIEIINRLAEQVWRRHVRRLEDHRAIDLIPAADGSGLAGVLMMDMRSGEPLLVRARATLLATGGFGGDPQLRAELIHPQARDMPLRANRGSTGDGLRLGRSAGAAFGEPNAGFYGHLIPSRIAYVDPYEFATLTFYHSEHGVLLNLEGRRFCDETIADHISPMHLIEQPEARALLIYDQHAHDRWMMQPYVQGVEPVDKFKLAYRRGARCAVAEDLEEFAELPEEWGYPGPAVLDALRDFNRRCEAGAPEPGRANDARPLSEPPYYVIEVIPAVTFSFGGLRIDPQARVLDESGTPIPGLLAAGADTGGVFVRAYAGGLANALIFGLQAAATALAAARPAPARAG